MAFGAVGVAAHDGDPILLHQKSQKRIPRALYRDVQLHNYIPSDQIDWKAVAAGQKTIRVRQLPGPQNSMGKLKFSFANGEDIYLHDTPSKALFAKARRDLSNGCVRLEDAQRFGRWLLGREPVAPSAEPEQFVQLPKGIPIYLTYLTAQPVDGKIVYTTDIYGRDTHGSAQASAGSASHDRTSAN